MYEIEKWRLFRLKKTLQENNEPFKFSIVPFQLKREFLQLKCKI